jgi:hypothetical protein
MSARGSSAPELLAIGATRESSGQPTDFTITQAMAGLVNDRYVNRNAYAMFDAHFMTGTIEHTLILRSSSVRSATISPYN